ncbi:hypothetical protein [Nocardia niwae]|uniref:hypothetical protein n=1 Tax=Nocardia niwae TaxID=626084 RepID=UPI0033D8CD18
MKSSSPFSVHVRLLCLCEQSVRIPVGVPAASSKGRLSMNERDRIATHLFLRKDVFRSKGPTRSVVRADGVEPGSMRPLRAINFLAAKAEVLRSRSDPPTAADDRALLSFDEHRRRIERNAAAKGVPQGWIERARNLGDQGLLLRDDHLLPTPWVDHRAWLVRSIRADVERLTTMAAAGVVRAHRIGTADKPTARETFGTNDHHLLRNMRAIRTSAARTAQVIGADDQERQRLWHVPEERWQTHLESHLRAEADIQDRWWTVYTDPAIRAHVRGFVRNLPVYAELASPTGTRAETRTGAWPPEPSVWLAAAATALDRVADTTADDRTDPGSDIVLAIGFAEHEWTPGQDPTGEPQGPSWPNVIDQGPDPWE